MVKYCNEIWQLARLNSIIAPLSLTAAKMAWLNTVVAHPNCATTTWINSVIVPPNAATSTALNTFIAPPNPSAAATDNENII